MFLKFFIVSFFLIKSLFSTSSTHDLVIIGSGPAGLYASVFAHEGGVTPLIIAGTQFYGLETSNEPITNYLGIDSLTGKELVSKMLSQVKSRNIPFIYQNVISVDFSKRPYSLQLDDGSSLNANSLIIATGSIPRKLPELQDTIKFASYGFKEDPKSLIGKDVLIVGAGDTAFNTVLRVAPYAHSITLLNNLSQSNALPALQAKIKKLANVQLYENAHVESIDHNGLVKFENNGTIRSQIVDHIIIDIGMEPNSQLFKGKLQLDKEGFIVRKNGSMQTSQEGIFAVGNVARSKEQYAIFASAEGALAGIEASNSLKHPF